MRIVFDLMFLKKRKEFGLEIVLSAVLRLASDVRKRRIDLRPAYGESAIPFLPLKCRQVAAVTKPS